MRLAKALQKLPYTSSRNNAALKRISWGSQIVPGFEASKLQQHLKEILEVTCHVRALGEILVDYERNERKLTSSAKNTTWI